MHKLAKSYQGAEQIGEPFEKNGKLYSKIKYTCPRCGGLGIIVARVENNQPIPIPVDNGVCYQCLGVGYITKDARLYTEKEFEQMERNNERARQRKLEKQEREMKEKYDERRREWLKKNGFNENETTFIITGESFSIKEDLKSRNFIYDPVLRWHKPELDDKYAERCVEVKLEDTFEINAFGQGHYKLGAADYINSLNAGTQVRVDSDWYGEVGDTIKNIKVQLIRRTSFQSAYGITNVLTFCDEQNHIFTWFTSTFPQIEEGSKVTISYATIKKNDEYKGEKITVILRPKFK